MWTKAYIIGEMRKTHRGQNARDSFFRSGFAFCVLGRKERTVKSLKWVGRS